MPIETPRKVALFHAYAELPSNHPGKPDKGSRLQVLAASEMLRRGEVDTVVFLAGHISPDGSTQKVGLSIAEKMTDQLKRNLRHIPEGAVIVSSDALSTRAEAEGFRRLSEDQGWDLTSVGKKAHLERVKRAIRRKFGARSSEVRVASHEEILTQNPRQVIRKGHSSPRLIDILYKKILDDMRISPEELAFVKRERMINLIDSVPLLGGWFLDNLNRIPIGKILEAWTHRTLSKRS